MKRFVRPKVEYVMRTMLSNHTWMKGLDDVVRGMAKKAFSLPRRTVISFSMCLGSMKDWGSIMWIVIWMMCGPLRCTNFDQQGLQSDYDVCQKLRDTVEARRAVKDASFDRVLKLPPGQGRESQK